MIRSSGFDVFFGSFTYSKNSGGFGIEPYGTPQVIVPGFVFSPLFI